MLLSCTIKLLRQLCLFFFRGRDLGVRALRSRFELLYLSAKTRDFLISSIRLFSQNINLLHETFAFDMQQLCGRIVFIKFFLEVLFA